MPLQNRVDPFGALQAVSARGSLMGNRGIIHDGRTRSLLKRRWTTKAWIICLCEFRGRKRDVMAPGHYTELFFLDEATALAAGHRPCFECQRQRAKAFSSAFAAGRGITRIAAGDMDNLLHRERMAVVGHGHPLTMTKAAALPDGTMVACNGTAFLIMKGRARKWSFNGYGAPIAAGDLVGPIECITPWSTVAALALGYRPSVAIAAPT